MAVVRDDLGVVGYCGDGFDRGADVDLDVAAGADVMSERPKLPLSDQQLAAVVEVAASLPEPRREVFLERLAARLCRRGGRPSDDDLAADIRAAIRGLIYNTVHWGTVTDA
jgi:hypothetical protein